MAICYTFHAKEKNGTDLTLKKEDAICFGQLSLKLEDLDDKGGSPVSLTLHVGRMLHTLSLQDDIWRDYFSNLFSVPGFAQTGIVKDDYESFMEKGGDLELNVNFSLREIVNTVSYIRAVTENLANEQTYQILREEGILFYEAFALSQGLLIGYDFFRGKDTFLFASPCGHSLIDGYSPALPSLYYEVYHGMKLLKKKKKNIVNNYSYSGRKDLFFTNKKLNQINKERQDLISIAEKANGDLNQFISQWRDMFK